VAIFIVYSETKVSYLDVGFNNGVISEKAHLLDRLDELLVRKISCDSIKGNKEELIVVKSQAVFLVTIDDGYDFCFYE
jgi:hypothetical protein